MSLFFKIYLVNNHCHYISNIVYFGTLDDVFLPGCEGDFLESPLLVWLKSRVELELFILVDNQILKDLLLATTLHVDYL